MPRFVEVSHQVEAGMKTYPGLPEPAVEVVFDYDDSRERYQGKAEFFIASLHLCGNTGTYVDSPVHRYRGGADLASLPLERLANLETVVVDCTGSSDLAIDQKFLAEVDFRDRAVLVRTDFSRHWGTPDYFGPNPFLTAAACQMLVRRGALFVGIDSLNIDDVADASRPAHTILLGAGIPVCENMTNLAAVPASGGRLHAVPIAWVGGASFPVRAYVLST
jgi:kynurenine formamidase